MQSVAPRQKTHPVVWERCSSVSGGSKLLAIMHESKKTSEETAGTATIGLRTVQGFIKNWKEPSSLTSEK